MLKTLFSPWFFQEPAKLRWVDGWGSQPLIMKKLHRPFDKERQERLCSFDAVLTWFVRADPQVKICVQMIRKCA
jgi:hypothetical protein